MERYDIGFLGMGAANGLLLLELERRNILHQFKILILEPDAKLKNDKTYCFWADSKHEIRTQLKDVLFHQWDTLDTVDGLEERRHHVLGRCNHLKRRGVLCDRTNSRLCKSKCKLWIRNNFEKTKYVIKSTII